MAGPLQISTVQVAVYDGIGDATFLPGAFFISVYKVSGAGEGVLRFLAGNLAGDNADFPLITGVSVSPPHTPTKNFGAFSVNGGGERVIAIAYY